jgi:diguanylate cyclase (GGDEF)-like protein/PAS domain S-box-containing protein
VYVNENGYRLEAAVALAAGRAPGAGAVAAAQDDAVVVADADLRIRCATPAVAELLGYDQPALLARGVSRLVHPADEPRLREAVERLLDEPGQDERLVTRLRDSQDRWVWVEGTVTNCLGDPEISGLVATLRDVTARVRSNDAVRLSGALHQAMVETSQEGIVVADEDGSTRYANPAMARLLGIPVERLYGVDPLALLGDGAAESAAAAGSCGGTWRHEVAYEHPEGSDRILSITRRPLGREPGQLGSLVMVTDVTESRHSERALRRRALYDPLTGLPNRYLVHDRLETAAARHGLVDGGTAVLFLDLDRFKPVNDAHGHDAGDELLRQVADRLRSAVRATDTVGRLGGDEFVLVCEDIDESGVTSVADRIHAALRPPFRLGCAEVEIGVSIGAALSPPFAVGELVEQADAAMYRTKRDGGGCTFARP